MDLRTQMGPTFTVEFKSEMVFSNTEGVLIPCTAFGIPAPEIDWIWSENNSIVNSIPGRLEKFGNGSLFFPPFSDALFDEKFHSSLRTRCLSRNPVGALVSPEILFRPGGFTGNIFEVLFHSSLLFSWKFVQTVSMSETLSKIKSSTSIVWDLLMYAVHVSSTDDEDFKSSSIQLMMKISNHFQFNWWWRFQIILSIF